MCMASVDRQSIFSPPSKKHPRDDHPPLAANLDPEPLPKRPCPDLPSSDYTAPPLSLLEELYEFENSLDASAVESGTQEDLVAEMMKSLEKVIEAIDESSLPEINESAEPSQCLRLLPELEGLPSTVPDCILDFDLQHGLSVGSPHSPLGSADESAQSIGANWPLEEERCLDFEASVSLLPTVADTYSHLQGVWLDGSFDQLGDSFTDCPREQYDLISLDSGF